MPRGLIGRGNQPARRLTRCQRTCAILSPVATPLLRAPGESSSPDRSVSQSPVPCELCPKGVVDTVLEMTLTDLQRYTRGQRTRRPLVRYLCARCSERLLLPIVMPSRVHLLPPTQV